MAEYLPAHLERVQKPEVETSAPTRKDPGPSAHPLLGLQARAGNQAIARMVQRHGTTSKRITTLSARERREEEETSQMKHDPRSTRERMARGRGRRDGPGQHDPALQRESEAARPNEKR